MLAVAYRPIDSKPGTVMAAFRAGRGAALGVAEGIAVESA